MSVLISEPIVQILAETLNISDLNNFRLANQLTEINCRIPIWDPDSQIQSINGLSDENYEMIYKLEKIGSIKLLLESSLNNNFELVKFLLAAGLNPNITGRYQKTPLILASEMGNNKNN